MRVVSVSAKVSSQAYAHPGCVYKLEHERRASQLGAVL